MLNFVWFSVLERKCWCSDIFAKLCLLLRTASHVSDAAHLPLVQFFPSSTRKDEGADWTRKMGAVDSLENQNPGSQKQRSRQGGTRENSVC